MQTEMLELEVRHANAVLDTGFAGETAFGHLETAQHKRRNAYYMPRISKADVRDGVPELSLVFAHGTVCFRFLIHDDRHLEIEARWDVRNVRRLCLQLPVIVWRGATLKLDGAVAFGDAKVPAELTRELSVSGGPFGSQSVLRIPADAHCRVHRDLTILRSYLEPLPEPERYQPLFGMALVSCQWTDPQPTGKASFHAITGR